MPPSISELQAKRDSLVSIIEVLSNIERLLSGWIPTSGAIQVEFAKFLNGDNQFSGSAAKRVLAGTASKEDLRTLELEAQRQLQDTYRFDHVQLKSILEKLLALWEPYLKHYRVNSQTPDSAPLLAEVAELLPAHPQDSLRALLKQQIPKEIFALFEKKAINEYWWLKIFLASRMPLHYYYPLNGHLGVYALRAEMHLPFGLPGRHTPFSDGSDFVVPVLKGAMLLESDDVPPARFVTNPIYQDDTPREFAPTAELDNLNVRKTGLPVPLMTYDEARATVQQWERDCDPYNIQVRVLHVPSGKKTAQIYEADYRKALWNA